MTNKIATPIVGNDACAIQTNKIGVPSIAGNQIGVPLITETASIAYTGELLPTGTASYSGISIDATKRYLKNSGKDKTPALVESGQGKFFNGTSQYINTGIIPNQAEGTLVTRFTYATGMANRCIIGSVKSDATNRCAIIFNSLGKLGFAYSDKSSESTYTNRSFVNGMSYHLVSKYSGSTYSLYINGVLEYTYSNATPLTSPVALYIGALNYTTANYFNNVIDETYYYDVALTDAQIEALYKYPEKVKEYNGAIVPDIGYEANCKLFLPLCENSGSNVYNVATNPATALALTNYTTDMHTSAAKLSYGAQCTAWKRDSLGVLLGMSNGLSFDGAVSVNRFNTAFIPTSSTDFAIEIIQEFKGVSALGCFNGFANSSTDRIILGERSTGTVFCAVNTILFETAKTLKYQHLVLLKRGNNFTAYLNGVQFGTTQTATLLNTTAVFQFGGLIGYVNYALASLVGTPKIHKGTQYAKFNIEKSWKSAQKIIAKLGA